MTNKFEKPRSAFARLFRTAETLTATAIHRIFRPTKAPTTRQQKRRADFAAQFAQVTESYTLPRRNRRKIARSILRIAKMNPPVAA